MYYQTPQKPKLRIKPRFFLFLLLLGGIIYGLVRFAQGGGTGLSGNVATVEAMGLGDRYPGEILIAREERLVDTETYTRIDFIAGEGALVYKGGLICKVYSAGYSQAEVQKLEEFRNQIKQYHRGQLVQTISDATLTQYNDAIAQLALEASYLVQDLGIGSLTNLETQLASALSARKSYLQSKYPENGTLSNLYDNEQQRLRKIEGWTTTYDAKQDGLVSFYTDGFEVGINDQTFDNLTLAQVRSAISGVRPDVGTVARGRQPIFRTVRADRWYALLITRAENWNPVVGQSYQLQLDGFDSYLVNAQVVSFTRAGGEMLVRLQVDADVRPVLNIRSCGVKVGEFIDGLKVPENAIRQYENMYGVVIPDTQQGTFVPVTVISYDNAGMAFVKPVYAGSLMAGQQVRLFPK